MDTGKGAFASGGAEKAEEGQQGRVEQLERELQRERVEKGRVKALSGEIAEKDARIAQLEAELSAAQSRGVIPDELRDSVPDEVVQASRYVANDAAARNIQPIETRVKSVEAVQEQQRQMMERQFRERISGRYPGFFRSVEGGDKAAQWDSFKRLNYQSLMYAYSGFDFEAVCYFIDSFYRELGVSPGADGSGAATPEPRVTESGAGVAAGPDADKSKTYTFEQYSGALEKSQSDFITGKISYAQYSAITRELQAAFDEGRVKEPGAK